MKKKKKNPIIELFKNLNDKYWNYVFEEDKRKMINSREFQERFTRGIVSDWHREMMKNGIEINRALDVGLTEDQKKFLIEDTKIKADGMANEHKNMFLKYYPKAEIHPHTRWSL